MFRSVRWPLALSYFLLILVCLGTLGYALLHAIRDHALRTVEANLRHHATFIASLMGRHLDRATLTRDERRLITDQMIALSRDLPGRMCIVNWEGQVKEDSDRHAPRSMRDHPEVMEALNGRPATEVRGLGPQVFWSEARDPTMHVAVPLVTRGNTVGAVYASRSLLDVQALMLLLEEQLYRAAMIAVVLAGVLSLVLARVLTAPLTRLTRAARLLADGHLEERIPVRSQDEIGALGRAFNEMAWSLQKQQDTLLQFVSDASHELKTPLASLKALSEVLEDGALQEPEAALRMVQHMRRETDRMERLVQDLLQLHRLESGSLSLDRRRVDLREVAEQSARQVDGRVQVTVEGPAAEVDADPDRLRQVLANLLENAVRATAGSEEPRVALRVEPEGGEVRLAVEDNGVGLAGADREKVFERFYRVDSGRGRQEGGAGLGLSICRRIVEAHGGRIWAEAAPEGGARFVFSLPRS